LFSHNAGIGMANAIPSHAGVLWYNGDFPGNSLGVLNGINMTFEGAFAAGAASVYDDFNVPTESGGWHVDSIWSNNLMTFSDATQATWSIRTNVASGDAGTVVADGTSPVTLTPTGRSLLEFSEFTVLVSALGIDLAPGTYWLSVTPHGLGGDQSSLNATTDGLNAIGSPPGDNGNSFLNSALVSADFQPLDEVFGIAPDFSMGVSGTVLAPRVVPEPAAIWLTALALATLFFFAAKQRTSASSAGASSRLCRGRFTAVGPGRRRCAG
jgi:hypothetical protein